ncbi:uncharacterized protein LOC134649097 [Cydia amplana]|uniref:uncharacterized protein LOC134649097 n=1 Tax=Cydia amplana TaxID=1869771 RepID=UPI002FE6AFD5
MEVVDAKLLLKLIISVLYVSIVVSVSSECETPLNSSDCGLPSTVVYTYYSQSSVCYPDLWRGCPTNNKFNNEDECLKSCVMYFEVTEPTPKKNDAIASKVQVKTNTNSQSVKIYRCDVPLNISPCTKQMKLVYTYSDEINSCIMAVWSGCPTENMFPDITSCQDNCQEKKDNKLKQKDKSTVQEASNVLKELIKKMYALNKENTLEHKDNSNVQEVSNVFKKLMKKTNALNKENKLDEKDIFKVQKVPNVYKKLKEKMEALKKGNKSGKTIDLDAKAYFIYKLVIANMELDERTEHGDIDLMLLDENVTFRNNLK